MEGHSLAESASSCAKPHTNLTQALVSACSCNSAIANNPILLSLPLHPLNEKHDMSSYVELLKNKERVHWPLRDGYR
jgi:hypothetical protein